MVMRRYGALELIRNGRGSGLYHYCVNHRNDVYPIGYCSPWTSCPACLGKGSFPLKDCSLCGGRGLIAVETPCPGHSTKEEAYEHYRQYLIDKAKFTGELEDTQHRCEICGEWTQKLAEIPGHIIWHYLCDLHCNRAGLSEVLPKVGESWAS